MKERLGTDVIAMRAARELFDGAIVNLGFGIPTLLSGYIPKEMSVIFHSENGILGYGSPLTEDDKDKWDDNLINASGQFVNPLPGMSCFGLDISFGMVRGGHIDITILGGLQVSEEGDLANWRIPGQIGRMGGAMDLAVGARRMIVAMEHVDKKGKPKVVRKCTYPLTGKRCVNLIITDLAVIEVTHEGLALKEIAPGWTTDEIQQVTEARLTIAPDLKEIEL